MKGYKGFKKGLKCLDFQYTEGENHIWKPKGYYTQISLCSAGFHFCTSLEQVLTHYPLDEEHEYAIIEAGGKILTGSDKCCSEELKVIKVLSKREFEEILYKEKAEHFDKQVFCLDIIQHLQNKYNFSVGGSTALYLNGYMLDRKAGSIDIDVVMPYYQKIEIDEFIDGAEEFDAKTSGNDFDSTVAITSNDGRFLKLDIRIKPEQRYDVTEYRGYKYKTSNLFTILEAKMRYAKDGVEKHKKDILSLLKEKNTPVETPFLFEYQEEKQKEIRETRKGRSYDEI